MTERVRGLIADIEVRGEAAVGEMSSDFDNWEPDQFKLTPDQVQEIVAGVAPSTIEDIRFAQTQIRNFAQSNRQELRMASVPSSRMMAWFSPVFPYGFTTSRMAESVNEGVMRL